MTDQVKWLIKEAEEYCARARHRPPDLIVADLLKVLRECEKRAASETIGGRRGCPCAILGVAEQCNYACPCARPHMSGPCLRCAFGGSREQQVAAARSLIERESDLRAAAKALKAIRDALVPYGDIVDCPMCSALMADEHVPGCPTADALAALARPGVAKAAEEE